MVWVNYFLRGIWASLFCALLFVFFYHGGLDAGAKKLAVYLALLLGFPWSILLTYLAMLASSVFVDTGVYPNIFSPFSAGRMYLILLSHPYGSIVAVLFTVLGAHINGSILVTLTIGKPARKDKDPEVYVKDGMKKASKFMHNPTQESDYMEKHSLSLGEIKEGISNGDIKAYEYKGNIFLGDPITDDDYAVNYAHTEKEQAYREALKYLDTPLSITEYCKKYDTNIDTIQIKIGKGELKAFEKDNYLFVEDKSA